MRGSGSGRAPAPARACRRRSARDPVAGRNTHGSSRVFSAQPIFSRRRKVGPDAPLTAAPPHDFGVTTLEILEPLKRCRMRIFIQPRNGDSFDRVVGRALIILEEAQIQAT